MEGVNVTLSAILNRLNTEGRDGGRTLVASFMGSMYTHPTRHKLETMKSADIQITATDWCVAAQPPRRSLCLLCRGIFGCESVQVLIAPIPGASVAALVGVLVVEPTLTLGHPSRKQVAAQCHKRLCSCSQAGGVGVDCLHHCRSQRLSADTTRQRAFLHAAYGSHGGRCPPCHD
jgi:hypothetical protein